MELHKQVAEEFGRRYGGAPAYIVRAPGRVNLIGEHTDYNDGFVLPMAIDRAAWIALQPNDSGRVNAYALEFGEEKAFSLEAVRQPDGNSGDGWAEYLKGTAWALQDAGLELQGWDGVVAGDVPIGAGLSSSAALELATARAFAVVGGLDWEPATMAKLGQRAENRWVGVNCGIMDQMISAAGEAGHALLIDCRTLALQAVPLPPETAVVVLDTGTRRGLVDSAYNERRAQCEAAAAHFGVQALRDVDLAGFAARQDELDATARRRARHVIAENERTEAAAAAMREGDAATLGTLMDQSHASLRDDFEVSSPALDQMVEIARAQTACLGARMTGAGFGGCAVALVRADGAAAFAEAVASAYRRRTDNEPSVYVCRATAGAAVVA